jgi:hemerythrin
MPLLTWKDEYSVNVEELDNHHKELIRILNELYSDCLKVDNIDCVGSKLDDLVAYASYHFQAEEQYMRQIQYFEVDEHIEKHHGFTYKITEMKQIPYENQLELTKDLIVYIGKWFLRHVLEEDKKYARYAAG